MKVTADNHAFKSDTKMKNPYPSYSVCGICLSLAFSLMLFVAPTLVHSEVYASSSGLKVIVHLNGDQGGNLCVYSRSENLGCESVEGETTEEFQFGEDSLNAGDKFRACLDKKCITGVNGPEKEPEHVSFMPSQGGSTSQETNTQSNQMNRPNPGDQSQGISADVPQNQDPSQPGSPPTGDFTDQVIGAMESGAIDPSIAGILGDASFCGTQNMISNLQGPDIENGIQTTHTDPTCPGMEFNGP
jgi:hypothetical protein